ncbi:MAG: 50S ribosomal protein L11 methyltransferase [Gammaproteobacteria bacterium]|nr:50S ribosomal protein L11 methyltransferase [Gammaproteobacteria bacterium]NNM20997.1 50S ribosomal protein L11 methyltransferase [Gammaproteobacteria bacterium]
MAWQKLIVEIGAEQRCALEEQAIELGALSVSLEDAGDEPLLEPAPGATPYWSRLRFSALFPDDVDREDIVNQLACAHATWQPLEERDWQRAALQEFEPACFGGRLWICPTGKTPGNAKHIVRLDPGLAFGTGRHATTALCLEWLAGNSVDGCTVLDFGCGSGVLGLAAVALGARQVFAADIDEQALTATRNNAAANRCGEKFHISLPGKLPAVSVDIVMANILAGPLIGLVPVLAGMLRPGGAVVLSGILDDQAEQVWQAYAPWFENEQCSIRAGWARLSGTRNDRVYTMS